MGAFHSESSAASVLAQAETIGFGEISPVLKSGQTLFRVRLGPVQTVAEADKLLDGVMNMGFSGAALLSIDTLLNKYLK